MNEKKPLIFYAISACFILSEENAGHDLITAFLEKKVPLLLTISIRKED